MKIFHKGKLVIYYFHNHSFFSQSINLFHNRFFSRDCIKFKLIEIVFVLLQVLWYRDTLRLDTTERRIMEVRGSRHTLVISRVQASDFGNYSCVADNSVGKARQYLELSGKFVCCLIFIFLYMLF